MIVRTIFIVAFALVSLTSIGQVSGEKVRQWQNLKFSMFIHWGLYSELGGVWEGKQISKGLSEQIQAHAGIYSDHYEAVARRFNPEKWNADSIVSLAKDAGMRSIVFTAKHHDGFCMFESQYTDFDVIDATPFGRDVLKELSRACIAQGLRFGIYFSLIDWHYPQASPISSHNSDLITAEHHEYNKRQVTELLTNYGTISELWFDMGSQSAGQSKDLATLVHRLQPDCLVGSRIGNDMGDFIVMGDNQEPSYDIDVPWQSPASFFDETWGYRSWQARGDEFEKAKEKLTSLIRVVSRGGNYLLNIGPRGDGSVVEFERNVLLMIGKWLADNGDAVYGTHPDPFHVPFEWGSITRRDDRLFLHVQSKPKGLVINLPGLKGKVKRAYTLSGDVELFVNENDQGVEISFPENYSFDPLCSLVAIEMQKGYTVLPAKSISDIKGHISLDYDNAFKHYSNSTIDYNTRFRSTTGQSWFVSPRGGSYLPRLQYTKSEIGKAVTLEINGKSASIVLDNDEPIQLPVLETDFEWARPLIAGPFFSSLEGVEDGIDQVSGDESLSKNSVWAPLENWKSGSVYELAADRMTAFYLLQEVISPQNRQMLISVGAGDGLVVFVNGVERFIHLDEKRTGYAEYTVLVPLIKGRNQILVKLFNNFQKRIRFSFGLSADQMVYQKRLDAVRLDASVTNIIRMRLLNPATPHQEMMLRNLSIDLHKEKPRKPSNRTSN